MVRHLQRNSCSILKDLQWSSLDNRFIHAYIPDARPQRQSDWQRRNSDILLVPGVVAWHFLPKDEEELPIGSLQQQMMKVGIFSTKRICQLMQTRRVS